MKDLLSVIICVHNMHREAPRTILSALPPYQKNVDGQSYEVIIVDNGSSEPLDITFLKNLPVQAQYVPYPGSAVSPVFALNWAALQVAKGNQIMFCIDGARIFSHYLVSASQRCVSLHPKAFVYSLGWHLGPKPQGVSSKEGYDQAEEDRLLSQIDWYRFPKKLFEIAVFANSSVPGFFSAIAESNAFTISRALLEELGGFDERFTSPGGGLANLEMFARYASHEDTVCVCLLGEGTFHQFHGGASTSGNLTWHVFNKEYSSIFGKPYELPRYQTLFGGTMREELRPFYLASLQKMNATLL